MSFKNLAVNFALGATLGPGFKATLGEGKKGIQGLGAEIKTLNSDKSRLEKFVTLKKDVQAASKELKTTQGRANALASEFKKAGGEVKRLEKELASAGDTAKNATGEEAKEARAKAAELKKALATAKKSSSDLGREFKTTAKAAGRLKKSFQDKRESLHKMRGALKEAGVSTKGLAGQLRGLEDRTERVARAQKKWAQVSARNRRSLQRLHNVATTTRTALGKLTAPLGILGLGAGAAFGAVTVGAGKSIEDITRFSQSLGVSTEFLSRTAFAAKAFGADLDHVQDGIKELSLRTDEFVQTGVGPAAEAFQRLGLSGAELAPLTNDTEALFDLVHSRIAQLDDAAARQRISDEIFGGTAGERLIELLKASSKEVANLRDESDKLGATVTKRESEIARAHAFALNRFKAGLTGQVQIIGVAVLPVLTKLLDKGRVWFIENQDRVEAFATKLSAGLESALPALGELVVGAGKFAVVVAKLVTGVAGLVGGFENLGIVVAGLFTAKLLVSIFSTTKAILGLATAVRTAKLAGKGGIIGDLGGALLGGGKGKGLKGLGSKTLGRAGGIVKGGGKALGKVFKPLGALLSGAALFQGVKTGNKKAVGGALGDIGGSLAGAAAGAAIGSVVPIIGTAIGGLIGAVAGGLGGEALGRSLAGSDSKVPAKPLAAAAAATAIATSPVAAQPNQLDQLSQPNVTNNITITVQAQPGQDVVALAKEVVRQIKRAERTALHD